MKYPFLFSLASLESPSSPASGETVVKMLHVNPPEVLKIWQAAAAEYKEAHPAGKVQFDYLDHEEFKANLRMLLQSSDRPSVFHSWGGGGMLEQIQAGVCQDMTLRANSLASPYFTPSNFTSPYRPLSTWAIARNLHKPLSGGPPMMQWQSGPQLSALIILPSRDQAGSSAARATVCIIPTATAIMVRIIFMASFV
jgi:hypothetical protein